MLTKNRYENGHGLFSLNEIKLICSFKSSNTMLAWKKLATDNFSTVLTKNLRNPRDYAPLMPKHNKSQTIVINDHVITEKWSTFLLIITKHYVQQLSNQIDCE